MAESFSLFGKDLFGNQLQHAQGTKAGPLARRFTVPPLSVLNARDGDWQARKRAWISLGIESETGRGGGERLTMSKTVQHLKPSADQTLKNSRAKFSGGLADGLHALREAQKAGEPAPDYQGQEQSGTSIFDPVLCELAYSWWCPQAGAVLDPFAGGSVRGIVAALLGLSYTGIDLRPEQVAANEEQAARIVPGNRPRWVVGDSADVAALVAADGAPSLPGVPMAPAYDFVFSCPPYGDLERYSDDPRDLSAMAHEGFVEAYRAIIAAACGLLRADRFACFVVGDFRDKRGEYRDFVSTTIGAFKAAGLALYNDAILVTAVGSLPIRVGKQFDASRKLGKTHQNVLVFVKGDGRRAAASIATPCEVLP